MSDLTDALAKALEDKDGDKNYDPRMEELMRSDKLIDPKAENLSELEDQEIFHISKIRGAQKGFGIPVSRIKKIYELPEMLDYHCDYMDYIRSLDPIKDKDELASTAGGLPMTNEMIKQLIYLRPSLEGKRAKLYADSIKPQVTNQPMYLPQPEQQEGFFSKLIGFFTGRRDDSASNKYSRR